MNGLNINLNGETKPSSHVSAESTVATTSATTVTSGSLEISSATFLPSSDTPDATTDLALTEELNRTLYRLTGAPLDDHSTLHTESAISYLELLKTQLEQFRIQYEHAFDDSVVPETSNALCDLKTTSEAIVSLLQSSALGGVTVAPPALSPEKSTPLAPSAVLALVQDTSTQVQSLYKEKQRLREGSEIAASILKSLKYS